MIVLIKGWHEAIEVALEEATKTIRGITGLEVVSKTAVVDPNTVGLLNTMLQ